MSGKPPCRLPGWGRAGAALGRWEPPRVSPSGPGWVAGDAWGWGHRRLPWLRRGSWWDESSPLAFFLLSAATGGCLSSSSSSWELCLSFRAHRRERVSQGDKKPSRDTTGAAAILQRGVRTVPRHYLGKSPASGKRGSRLVKAHAKSTTWKLSSFLTLLPTETTREKFFASVNTHTSQRGYLKSRGLGDFASHPVTAAAGTRGAPQPTREAQRWAATRSVLLSRRQPGPAHPRGSVEDLVGETESRTVSKGVLVNRDCFFKEGCAYHALEGLRLEIVLGEFFRAGKGQAEGRGALGRIPAGLGPHAATPGIAALYVVPAPLVTMAEPARLCLRA